MNSDKQIDLGSDFSGFSTSSPAAAMTSKPMNPKKQIAAPFITPAKPYGKYPPLPNPAGTWLAGMIQFFKSILKHPQMMT